VIRFIYFGSQVIPKLAEGIPRSGYGNETNWAVIGAGLELVSPQIKGITN
jgi:hypothetical protein